MKMWIDGRWTAAASGRTLYAVNPATEKRIARLPAGGERDLAGACEAAGRVLPGWSAQSVVERSRLAGLVARTIESHAAELGRLEAIQRGTPIRHAIPGMHSLAGAFETVSKVGPVLMNLIDPGSSVPYYLRPGPVGVCLFSPPWYAPSRTTGPRLASALVAGNTCVVECPVHDALAVLRLAKLIEPLGLPPGVLNILTGSRRSTHKSLHCSNDSRDSGNPAGGGIKPIPSVSGYGLSLPLIVLGDADADTSVEKAMLTAFGNCGLPWAVPDRYFVHESLYDAFVEKFIAAMGRIAVGDPADYKTDIGPALDAHHRDRIRRYIVHTLSGGATLLSGGAIDSGRLPGRGYFLPPTVIGDVALGHNPAEQTVFGPIVCLSRFSSINEILELTDREMLGPHVRVCTSDPAEEARVTTAIELGSRWWDGSPAGSEEEAEESTGCEFARAAADFGHSIRFSPVYKDYTTDFVRSGPTDRN